MCEIGVDLAAHLKKFRPSQVQTSPSIVRASLEFSDLHSSVASHEFPTSSWTPIGFPRRLNHAAMLSSTP